MAAVWTTPQTWANSVLVDATQLNAHVRDNMDYLFTRPRTVSNANAATDVTTTSTSFTDVDGAGSEFTISVATNGGRLMIGFVGTINHSAGTNVYRGYLDVDVDGSRVGGDDGLVNFGYSPFAVPCSFVVVTGVLSVATHTVKLQWKTNNAGNTLTCYMGAGTASADLHPQFWAIEV